MSRFEHERRQGTEHGEGELTPPDATERPRRQAMNKVLCASTADRFTDIS